MNSSPLSGPANVPADARYALVCLHGFGDVGQSWLDLVSLMKAGLPEAIATQLALFCPDAPDVTPFGEGRQWFSDNNWTFRDPPGLTRAAKLLDDYLTQTVSGEYKIPRERIILMGFSQGGMTTLHTAPRLNPPVAGHIVLAGRLMDTARPDPLALTPTLLLHGQDDDVLPADATLATETTFRDWGIPTETHIIPGLGHGANAQALAYIATFIQEIFKEDA
jgi:phospholipase/carboxylesterase